MADVKKLAKEIVDLTLLEAVELKNILKDEYGIEAASGGPVMVAGAAGHCHPHGERQRQRHRPDGDQRPQATAAVWPPALRLDHERAALDFLREVTLREELQYRFKMVPGDIQMVSNHSVFHSREDFVDHEEHERKRCLFRFWINIRGGRPLAENFADRYNTGPRGGVAVGDGARYTFS